MNTNTSKLDLYIQNLHLLALAISIVPMLMVMLIGVLLGKCSIDDIIIILGYIENVRYVNNKYDDKTTEDIAIVAILLFGMMVGLVYYLI